ncbi:MAG TPA: LytTR family DNA-binding domain-containing protein [Balneolaceae bacterium]|nr:LytTR family DNA-binding domain-containing protein [Balneolaceae bacterium]
MPSYKTIIVDEDTSARNLLAHFLAESADVEIVALCKNSLAAIESINSQEPDLVFLEIEMPDFSGFEILERIQITPSPFIIFTSQHPNYAAKAFEVDALDYIHKPVNRDRVKKSLERIRKRMNKEELSDQIGRLIPDFKELNNLKRFIIKQAGEYHLIRTKDIIWIESDGNYSRIITEEKKFMIRYTLSGFEEQLDPNRFYRISRSLIVNLDFVVKIKDHVYGNYLVELENGNTLKMSKNYKQLFEALKNF